VLVFTKESYLGTNYMDVLATTFLFMMWV